MADYVFRRGEVAKFWSPQVRGKQLFLRFGFVGKTGQTRLKSFASPAEAKAELERAAAEKLAAGYVLAGGAAAASSGASSKGSSKARTSNAKTTRTSKTSRTSKASKTSATVAATTAVARPALPAARRAALLALAEELGGPKVLAEATMSVDDPQAYVEKFVETYTTIEDVELHEAPWLGLIESLNEHGKLAEVDWKEAGSEVRAWLEKLGGTAAKRALAPADADGEQLDERYTHEVLELFGRYLAAAKLALIQLDKASDSYALMVVAARRVAPLQKLARGAGEKIVHFTGKNFETYEKERLKKLAKHSSTNPWTAIVAAHDYHRTGSAADSVLWNLNHGDKIDDIRKVAPFAPKRDQPLLQMTIAIYDGSASKLAQTTKDPATLLVALRYLNPAPPENRYERLAAAAILAERLKIKADGGARHMQVLDACNIWNAGKATDAQLARLPAAARDRLARLGDGMLERSRGEGGERWAAAFRMLTTCGDAKSLPLIDKAGERAIAQRVENEYDLTGPFVWDTAKQHIQKRKRAKR